MPLTRGKHFPSTWIAMLLVLSACSSQPQGSSLSGPSPATIEAVQQAMKERLLTVNNFSEPSYLDPGLLTESVAFNVTTALFEGLLEYNAKGGDPVLAVAERWDVSRDGKTYTFSLRKEAQWSDGHPVTADDFVYAWERVLNPKTGAAAAYKLYDIQNAKAYNTGQLTDPTQLGFRAINATTLQIVLTHPVPYFPHLICFPTFRPVPRWVVEARGVNWTRPEYIVTNGPFRLATWMPRKEIVVLKTPTYWDAEHVRLAGIRFLPIEESETGRMMYETGELDVNAGVPQHMLPQLRGRTDFHQSPLFATAFLLMNTTKSPLNDVRVRQALALAIDRNKLVEEYMHGAKHPAAHLVPEGLEGYIPAGGLSFDLQHARQLLRAAGYIDPATLPPIDLYFASGGGSRFMMEVVASLWKTHLGVTVALHAEENKSFIQRVQKLQYDISLFGWQGVYPDPNAFLEMFASTSTDRFVGWRDAHYDQLIANAAAQMNRAKRLGDLREAETILLQAAAVVPLFTDISAWMIRSYVKGYDPNIQGIHPWKWVYLDAGNGGRPTTSTATTGGQ